MHGAYVIMKTGMSNRVLDVDGGPLVSSLEPLEQIELLIESLDIGVMLVDATGHIFRSNMLAHQHCALYGTTASEVPPRLWELLRPLVESGRQLGGRFTAPVAVATPDGQQLQARCRQLPYAAFAVTLTLATLREVEVRQALAERYKLSPQETRIAFLAAQGHRNREIAERLAIVEGTVKNYLTNVFSALAVRSRTELATRLAQLVDTD